MKVSWFDKNRIQRWIQYTDVLAESPTFYGPWLSVHRIVFPPEVSASSLSMVQYLYIDFLRRMLDPHFNGFLFTEFQDFDYWFWHGPDTSLPLIQITVVFDGELTPDQQAKAHHFWAQMKMSLFFQISQRQSPCGPEEPLSLDFTPILSRFILNYLDLYSLARLSQIMKPFPLVRGWGFLVAEGRYHSLQIYMEELEEEFLNLGRHGKLPKYGVPFLPGPSFSEELQQSGWLNHPLWRRIYAQWHTLFWGR